MSLYIQIGAGVGDQDKSTNYEDGFTNFVKNKNINDKDKILVVEANPMNIEKLNKLSWDKLKEELMCEFSLKREYNINEKLELLFSIEKGHEESRDNFLLRISMIVCCIERGNIVGAQTKNREHELAMKGDFKAVM